MNRQFTNRKSRLQHPDGNLGIQSLQVSEAGVFCLQVFLHVGSFRIVEQSAIDEDFRDHPVKEALLDSRRRLVNVIPGPDADLFHLETSRISIPPSAGFAVHVQLRSTLPRRRRDRENRKGAQAQVRSQEVAFTPETVSLDVQPFKAPPAIMAY